MNFGWAAEPRGLRTLLLIFGLLAATRAGAAEVGSPDDVWSLDAHGFASQGFIYTTHQNNYLARSNRGSFEFADRSTSGPLRISSLSLVGRS